MRIFLLITFALFLSGCSTPGTNYVPAKTLGQDGFIVKDSPGNPGHGVAVFQANKNTKPVLAVAYTVLAAHQACISKKKVSVVLPPRYFKKDQRFASSYQCEKNIKLIHNLPTRLKETADGVLVLDEFTGLPFLPGDLIKESKVTDIYHKANTTKENQLEIKIVREGVPKTITVKLDDKTEHYKSVRKKDMAFLCENIRKEGIKEDAPEYPQPCL